MVREDNVVKADNWKARLRLWPGPSAELAYDISTALLWPTAEDRMDENVM
mgnify:CR=1 FL=1